MYNEPMAEVSLEELLESVRKYPGLTRKRAIGHWARRFVPRGRMRARVYGPGDDAGAVELPGGGYLLLAGEGIWSPLLDDPEFAGFCAVTVNVNDIYAMGGQPLGLVSIIFSGGLSDRQREGFLDGLEQALEHYGVPLLGGHTSPEGETGAVAVCVAGRSQRLMRGDGARPGHAIVAALDLEGNAHPDFHAWDTVRQAESARTMTRLAALTEIASGGLAAACRDISNPGILGTLAMLLEGSGSGALVELDMLPVPAGVDLDWWLKAYPSFGFLFSVAPDRFEQLAAVLDEHGVEHVTLGQVREGSAIDVRWKGETSTFLDWRQTPVTGLFTPRDLEK
ncbi:MAG TPA: AIR synthase related protein [Candidatus Anoxymicrobiaceae bacterium]